MCVCVLCLLTVPRLGPQARSGRTRFALAQKAAGQMLDHSPGNPRFQHLTTEICTHATQPPLSLDVRHTLHRQDVNNTLAHVKHEKYSNSRTYMCLSDAKLTNTTMNATRVIMSKRLIIGSTVYWQKGNYILRVNLQLLDQFAFNIDASTWKKNKRLKYFKKMFLIIALI